LPLAKENANIRDTGNGEGWLNEQSLQAANAFLRIASESTQAGDFLERSPADIGKDAGLANPLAVARAVRALAARRRLEAEDGRYRLLDARPLEPGRPEAGGTADRRATYSDLGRSVIDRIIELGREAGEAVAVTDHLRREAKENRAARIEAEQRASRLFERVKELETKLDMAEANLRTVLAAARGRGATAAPTDNEMEALLRILKSPSRTEGAASDESVKVPVPDVEPPETEEAAGGPGG